MLSDFSIQTWYNQKYKIKVRILNLLIKTNLIPASDLQTR